MALIKSISGIRGTIGGKRGENLTPIDVLENVSAYGTWLIKNHGTASVVVGRDGRISGPMVSAIVNQSLLSLGINVIDLDLTTTPTVEMAVKVKKAQGGIIITASHNPKEWNALKLLNEKGEFLSAADGAEIDEIINKDAIVYAGVDAYGTYSRYDEALEDHIAAILALDLFDIDLIKSKNFKVAIDAINSTGNIAVPALLDHLNVSYESINEKIDGHFAHNPEPLPKNLIELSSLVGSKDFDLGIAVDPDVDRLAFICGSGEAFGEELTIVAASDFVLSKKQGATVSNLSSSRALSDVTKKHGGVYYASAVGEVNVVKMMKSQNAVIGGEGNGGVIYPELHYGRDALIGIVMVLNLLAERSTTLDQLKASYPNYQIIKDKLVLDPTMDIDATMDQIADLYADENVNRIDGLKIDFPDKWVHLRRSNTEAIIRIYAESEDQQVSEKLVKEIKDIVLNNSNPLIA